MKVAFNILPLQTTHKTRGIGFYTQNLLAELEKDADLKVVKFADYKDINAFVDIMHYPWFDLFFRQLPFLSKYPMVITIHDLIPMVFPEKYPIGLKGGINNFFQKLALRKCRYIITDSNASRKDIIKKLGVNKDKVVVIPLAAGKEFKILSDVQLLRIKRKYNLPNNYLLYIGDANWVKNLPFLIQGFNKLVKETKFQDYKLVLVGGVFLKNVENINHPELESLRQVNRLIKEYKLENKIIRPGFLGTDELVAFYNLATVYIQPSLYEGFGLPILEAMACGCPVVSSNTASLPELGEKSVAYFDPRNPGQFMKVLIEVLEDNSLRSMLSKLGLERAKIYSWEKTANKTKEVYRQALLK